MKKGRFLNRPGGRTGRRMHRGVVIALCLLIQIPVAVSGVYRWVDENGKTHYGDRPPAEQQADEIKQKQTSSPNSPPSQNNSAETRQRLLDRYEQEREEKKEAARKKREEAEKRKRNCELARKRLKYYESYPLLYEKLPDGERRYLSAEEKDADMRKLREAVEHWCK